MRFFYTFCLFLTALCFADTAKAQLDSIHWIPPMHGRSELGPQYLYLSTPEKTPFTVTIRDGGGTVRGTVTISNALPARWTIGSSGSAVTMVQAFELQKAVKNRGLVLVGEKKYYVNLRFHSDSQYQAADLTCKGLSALGTVFRVGHVYQGASNSQRSNFVGAMATEDSTVVTLSEFAAGTVLQIGGISTPVSSPQSVTLMAGESVVYSLYVGSGSEPPNGLIGSKVASNKPIVVNCGSWTGSPVDNSNDVGIDQIAPFERVGEEYILCKGNGSADLETPLVIAHLDNTSVWLNGSSTPAAVLNAGKYLRIPTSSYSAAGNLYIQTSQPAFVYQIMGGVPTGDDAKRTAGLIFVPPISCSIPNAVDNIYQPNQIGNIIYDGGLMIVAMKDSMVEVRIDNNLVSLGTADAVLGNPDFVTYRRLSLFSEGNPINTTSIIAKGAVQVAMFGRNGAAGFGSFYSGFSQTSKADIALKIVGDGVCPDTLIANGRFDGVQWYYADSLLSFGPDTLLVAYAPGQYTARGYLGVCRRTNFVEDTVTAVFNSPVFPYESEDPACYGFRDGKILFGTPFGGLEPYQYSVNQGFSFSNNPIFSGLRAGNYQLVVRDSTGCYNRPLEINIGQPDSLSVTLAITKIDVPVKVGDAVLLQATPNRAVTDAQWFPSDAGIPDFLHFTAKPLETTNYTITVTDSEGCTASDLVRIVIEPNIFTPNIFNPESSLGNERFTLFSKDNLPVNWLRIYDRWGNLVFENKGFMTNDRSSGWDGSYRGNTLTPAVFVFIAAVEYEPGRIVHLQGDVTLVR